MVSARFDDAYVPEIVPEADLEFFDKSGYGARMGWGESPALLLVDMTNQFASSDYALGRTDTGDAAVAANRELLDAARTAELPVFYTVGPDERFNIDAYRGVMEENREGDGISFDAGEGNHVVDELRPRAEDVVVEKAGASGFFDTHLGNILRYYGVDTLIVTGMTTSGCVRATVVDAYCSNFYPIVPIECVADRSSISHEIALFDMDMKYGDVSPLDDVLEQLRLQTPVAAED